MDSTDFNNWKYGMLRNSCLDVFPSRKLEICHQLAIFFFFSAKEIK